MSIKEKWIAELHTLEKLQTVSSPNYTMYWIRAAEIKLIKQFLNDLNQSNAGQ